MPTPWSRAARQAAMAPTLLPSNPAPATLSRFILAMCMAQVAVLTLMLLVSLSRLALLLLFKPTLSTPHQHQSHPSSAPYSIPTFVTSGPPPIYTPHAYGVPGFTTHGSPTHPPTIVSSGLDLVSVPNSRSDGAMVCQPRVLKHARGKDAVDVEKLVSIATQAPSSEYLMRYFTAANVHDPTTYSPKVAEYYTNQALAIDMLLDRCNDYNIMASLEMNQYFTSTLLFMVAPRSTCSPKVTWSLCLKSSNGNISASCTSLWLINCQIKWSPW
jgi:hypothetical protein